MIKTPSTLMRFRVKKHTFGCVFPYRPHYNAECFHRKRIHLKTLSRVDTFETEAFRKHSETKMHQYGQRISMDRLSNMLTSFVYLSHAQMTIVKFSSDAFSNENAVVTVDGENAAKTIVWTDAILVKTVTARFENGAKRKCICVSGA